MVMRPAGMDGPAEVWAASPVEIEAAFSANVDRLVKLMPGLAASDQPNADSLTHYTLNAFTKSKNCASTRPLIAEACKP